MNSDMSFAVSRNNGSLEWAGKNLNTIFAQRSNLLNPNMWRMIYEVVRFNEHANRIAEEADAMPPNSHPFAKMSLGEFFKKFNYSKFFYENYLLPMTAAIWSMPADKTFDEFPLVTLVQFMRNHHLLQVSNRPKWKTIPNGSKSYVEKIVAQLDDCRLKTKVVGVKRMPNKVNVICENGTVEEFDHVIFATHTDQALEILGDDATPEETEILGGVKFSQNKAYLHRDETLMPKNRTTWSSWNYLTEVQDEAKSTTMCLSYWMNNLQTFIDPEVFGNVIVTMNPTRLPDENKVLGSWNYTHPSYSSETIKSQDELHKIQNKRRTLFAGAWTNYGFHEDGCTSGLLAAAQLGAKCPFEIVLNGGRPKYGVKKADAKARNSFDIIPLLSITAILVACIYAYTL
ncbi:hypothetical protein HK103_004381 [Boothiomyces macroporosus]|uniref:Amine oxidase domain-containing protein n=1 Tax=Boothiomyces macroporosus TaxID=261099 RepID=A0AAD5UKY3_9FUNG|nr:hypothetical protein HK103_004381 [Boothiomyces macroporosus]